MTGRVRLLLLLAVPAVSGADHDGLFETASRPLGPVFTTPAERSWLDARRGLPIVTTEDAAVEKGVDRPLPVGVIIPTNGAPSVWRDGDFVKVRSSEVEDAVRIDSNLRIERHPPAAPPRQTEDVRDDAAPR